MRSLQPARFTVLLFDARQTACRRSVRNWEAVEAPECEAVPIAPLEMNQAIPPTESNRC
jgi:hypothetical protein